MDNTNNVSQSILQSSTPSYDSADFNDIGTNNTGFFDSFKNINATTWLLIILILAFLGFNIFVYLAKGTEDVTNFFAPLLKKIFGVSIATTSQVVDVSAEGAKAVVGGTAGAIQTGLSAVQDVTPNSATSTVSSQPLNQQQKPDTIQQSSLNTALNTSQPQQPVYEADSASSSIQGGGKAGWCYIGEDRGFRTCAEIGVNDTCMSGEIFPSQEICMNPNLRN
jgi:hypothetical protein